MNPDLILLNGKIHSLNTSDDTAEAIAIFGPKIVCLGKNADIEAMEGPNTNTIDLQGRVVVPGLIDTHIHAAAAGLMLKYWVDCTTMKSIADIRKAIRKKVSRARLGAWIRGKGYDEFRLRDGRPPDRTDLDDITPDNPCAIWRGDGHILTVNSRALKLAGITKHTPDPAGGRIYRDGKGYPTGILAENAQKLVTKLLPEATIQETKSAIVEAQSRLAKWGITGYDEALATKQEMIAYQELKKEGKLNLRVGLMLAGSFVDNPIASHAIDAGLRTGFGDEWLRIVGVKFIADGSMASRTAALVDPYPKTDETGLMLIDTAELYRLIQRYSEEGLRPCIHAIGDRAVGIALDAVEKTVKAKSGVLTDHRIRIEHCGLVSQQALRKIKELGIVVSSSIGFLYSLGDAHLRLMGEERLQDYYPGRSYIDKNIVAAGNSDWSVTPANPMLGIYGLVTRTTEKGQKIAAKEGVSVTEALRFYTSNAAFIDFQENTRGTIRPGNYADLTVLNEDVFTVPEERLKNVTVFMTVVGGNIVYSSS